MEEAIQAKKMAYNIWQYTLLETDKYRYRSTCKGAQTEVAMAMQSVLKKMELSCAHSSGTAKYGQVGSEGGKRQEGYN